MGAAVRLGRPRACACRVHLLSTARAAALAFAALSSSPARADGARSGHGALAPLAIDLQGTLSADVPFATLGAGVAGDVGLARLGPGVLAVGGAASYEICGSVCWYFSASTPLSLARTQVTAQARATYRMALSGSRRIELYPLVTAGPVVTSTTIGADGGAVEHRGRSVGLALGGGVGGSVFVAGPVFLGGEARLRFPGVSPRYDLPEGADARLDRAVVDRWSLATFLTGVLDVVLAVGVRIP